MEKMFVEKAKELKKLLDGKDSGDIQNYMEVVKKYEKYSIQELHKIIMEKAKENKTVIEK